MGIKLSNLGTDDCVRETENVKSCIGCSETDST